MVLRIGCPISNDGVLHQFTKETIHNIGKNKDINIEFALVRGFNTGLNRSIAINGKWDSKNKILKETNDNRCFKELPDYDYFLSIDPDIEFKAEDVLKLIKCNLPIVGGAYVYRWDQNLLNAGMWNGKSGFTSSEYQLNINSKNLNKCDWLGSGFLLIKRIVLQSIGYPQFYNTIMNYSYNGIRHVNFIADDIAFCLKAENAGFDRYINCNIRVKHHVDK